MPAFAKTDAMHSKLDSKFNQFARGFVTPIRALSLISGHPRLLLLSLLPVLVTFLIVIGFIYFAMASVWAFAIQFLNGWFPEHAWIGGAVFVILSLAVLAYLAFHAFSILISLIASPFNDLLAEETERVKGIPVQNANFLTLVKVFLLDLRKTALSLTFIVFFSILGLVPFLGLLSIPGLALIQALTFVTYPQSRRRQGILESLSFIRNHVFSCLGFGLAVTLLFAIPIINLFALPVAVVGGTLLFLENQK